MSVMQPDVGWQQDITPPLVDHVAALKFLDFIFGGVTNAFIEFKYFSQGCRAKVVGQPTYLSTPLEHELVKSEIFLSHGDQAITVGLAPRFRIPAGGRGGGVGTSFK